jgi:hypothetical protein
MAVWQALRMPFFVRGFGVSHDVEIMIFVGPLWHDTCILQTQVLRLITQIYGRKAQSFRRGHQNISRAGARPIHFKTFNDLARKPRGRPIAHSQLALLS